MTRFGGTNKVVVLDMELLPAVLERIRQPLDELQGRHARFRRRLLHLGRVLIRSRQQPGLLTAQPLVARQPLIRRARGVLLVVGRDDD